MKAERRKSGKGAAVCDVQAFRSKIIEFQEDSTAMNHLQRRPVGGARPGAGRPKGVLNRVTIPIKELAASHSEESINTLVYLRDHSKNDQVRLAAARELLDGAHGRPRQEIDMNNDKQITVLVNRGGRMVEAVHPVQPALESHTADSEGNEA